MCAVWYMIFCTPMRRGSRLWPWVACMHDTHGCMHSCIPEPALAASPFACIHAPLLSACMHMEVRPTPHVTTCTSTNPLGYWPCGAMWQYGICPCTIPTHPASASPCPKHRSMRLVCHALTPSMDASMGMPCTCIALANHTSMHWGII